MKKSRIKKGQPYQELLQRGVPETNIDFYRNIFKYLNAVEIPRIKYPLKEEKEIIHSMTRLFRQGWITREVFDQVVSRLVMAIKSSPLHKIAGIAAIYRKEIQPKKILPIEDKSKKRSRGEPIDFFIHALAYDLKLFSGKTHYSLIADFFTTDEGYSSTAKSVEKRYRRISKSEIEIYLACAFMLDYDGFLKATDGITDTHIGFAAHFWGLKTVAFPKT